MLHQCFSKCNLLITSVYMTDYKDSNVNRNTIVIYTEVMSKLLLCCLNIVPQNLQLLLMLLGVQLELPQNMKLSNQRTTAIWLIYIFLSVTIKGTAVILIVPVW